jgi:hypothetical protein
MMWFWSLRSSLTTFSNKHIQIKVKPSFTMSVFNSILNSLCSFSGNQKRPLCTSYMQLANTSVLHSYKPWVSITNYRAMNACAIVFWYQQINGVSIIYWIMVECIMIYIYGVWAVLYLLYNTCSNLSNKIF